METMAKAYIFVIPVLICLVFWVITRKDKQEDALLKKRITESIRKKSESSSTSSLVQSETENLSSRV